MSEELPQNTEIENRLLSGLVSGDAEGLAALRAEGVSEDCFAVPQNRDWWMAVCARHDSGLPIDPLLLWEDLLKAGHVENTPDGRREWMRIVGSEPTAAHVLHHGRVLREKLALRTLAGACEKAGAKVCEGAAESAEVAKILRRAIDESARIAAGRQRSRPIRELLSDWLDEWEERLAGTRDAARFPTGLRPLDAALGGGLTRGGLTVVSGQTGSGKTALAFHLSLNAALRGSQVFLSSLEMLDNEVVERFIANLGEVPLQITSDPTENRPSADQKARISDAFRLLSDDCKMRVSDVTLNKVGEIVDELALIDSQNEGGVQLAVVDYLQLVDGTKARGETREREVAGISRALHLAGLHHGCVVVAMSQLNDDGRLRESRAIGQDAKTILQVKEDGILIVKNRQGPGRDQLVPLVLDGPTQRFVHHDHSQDDEQEDPELPSQWTD